MSDVFDQIHKDTDIFDHLHAAAAPPPAYPKPANPITNPAARAGVSDEQAQKFAAAAKRESAGDLGATLGIAGAAVPGGPLVKGIAAGLGQLGGEAAMGERPTPEGAAVTMGLSAGIPLVAEAAPMLTKAIGAAAQNPVLRDVIGVISPRAGKALDALARIKAGVAERAAARTATVTTPAAAEAAPASQILPGEVSGTDRPEWRQQIVSELNAPKPAPAVAQVAAPAAVESPAQSKLVEIKAGVAERAKARATSRAKVTARAKPAQPTPITQPAPEPEPVAAAAAPAPAPGRPVAVPEPDDLSAQLQASIDAVKKNGKPASNAPVPSTAKNAAADEDLKAKAGETTAAIVDRERTRRALAIGRFVKEHIPEEDIPNMTDEHFRSVAPLAGIENPSSDTIGKVRELLSMGRGR